MSRKQTSAGMTFIELIVVMGIFFTLFALVSLNLLHITLRATLNSSIPPLIADMKSQQMKAMVADTEGQGAPDSYGISFSTASYTMFKGSSFNAADPTSVIINLGESLEFLAITFPQSTIVFSRGSGQIAGFTDGANTLTIHNTNSNETKTITINRLGVVTSVN